MKILRTSALIVPIGFAILMLSFRCASPANANTADFSESAMEQDGNEDKQTSVLKAPEKKKAILYSVMNMVEELHYSPKKINDEFSMSVYDKFLERVDYGKTYLLQSDIKKIETNKKKIDNQLSENSTQFYDEVKAILDERHLQIKGYYDELIKTDFDFNTDETIQLDGKKMDWAKNENELKDRWRKTIKYRILAKYVELVEEQDTKKDTVKDWVMMSDAKMKDSARVVVKKNMDYFFRKTAKNGDDEYFSIYVNSICGTIDPHTDFFAPKEKEKFDEQMSGTFYGIGAALQNKDGVCVVSQIISGSPCWKQGKLKVDDKIMRVAQGNGEPIDIGGWDIDDIVSKIRGKKGSEVRLTVKHKDGTDEIIPIVRDEVHQEDVFAKSYILQEGKNKVGYIFLPEFYADFNKAGGKRCAIDMAVEVEKLKTEGVDGIVIDLRGNGGGSLSDVVDISSFFQGDGPTVQVKSKGSKSEPLSNSKASGILYNGPMAIMVNGGSASASEILAGAMQDYKRAVIVGSPTFGKGTVQRVFEMDKFYDRYPLENNPKLNELGSLGAIKLTIQKFYRISGNSTQLKGVVPDVQFPDLYMYLDGGERRDKAALPFDMTDKLNYQLRNMTKYDAAIAKSKARILANDYYKIVDDRAKQIKQQQDDNQYSLNLIAFKKQIAASKEFAKKLEELEKTKELLDAYNCRVDVDKTLEDEISKKKNEDWLKLLKKDAGIKEAFNIIKDLI
jgi:carboxyl-terminal processing protease